VFEFEGFDGVDAFVDVDAVVDAVAGFERSGVWVVSPDMWRLLYPVRSVRVVVAAVTRGSLAAAADPPNSPGSTT
jgi:hypothetical protein